MFHVIILITVCLGKIHASGPEPTVIFLNGNGRPMVTSANDGVYSSPGANGYNSYGSPGATIISALKSRESSRSESSGGSLYSLIRERLGEKLQERSSKKGPRIIVIPQMGKGQQNQQQQQQQASPQGYQQQQASGAAVAAYPMTQSSPYASSYSTAGSYAPAASNSYPSFAPYSPYSYSPSLMGYQNSYPYSQYGVSHMYPNSYASNYQYGSGGSSGLQQSASASTPYASYAYAPSNFFSNLMSSGSSLFSKSSYASLYPYLAQILAQTF